MDKIDKNRGVDTIASKIRQYMQNGIDLDPEIEALITELTGHPISTLDTLLKDDTETESVISLLMTPDTLLQAVLEPLLWQFPLTPSDEETVIHALRQQPPTIAIRLSNGTQTLQWIPPDWAMNEYIARLHLTWPIEAELFQGTDHFLTTPEKIHFWICLRGTQSVISPAISQNLVTFVAQKDHFSDSFFDHLDLLLTTWSNSAACKDPHKALVRLKGSYVKALRQIHRFDVAARSHNMETLMLQGTPTPTITMETALHQISMIDNLTLTLFGTISSVDDMPEMLSITEKHLKQMIQ